MKTDQENYQELVALVGRFAEENKISTVDIIALTTALATALYAGGTQGYGSVEKYCYVVRTAYAGIDQLTPAPTPNRRLH